MDKKRIKDHPEYTETPLPETSWSPAPGKPPIHSKMDWMDDVHFKSVRGVEIHNSTEPLLHPHSD
jgi:hypothetical protein